MTIPTWEMLLRLLAATAIGMLLGLERAKSKKPAGVRTHVLVCLAACLIAIISAYGFGNTATLRSDPARLVVGVLTGIGFLGAGIIWKSPTGSVQGITTAAEIFLLAALGIAVGLGLYILAAAGTVLALITMIADDIWEKYRKARARRKAAAATSEAAGHIPPAEASEEERQRPYKRIRPHQ